MRTVTAPPRQSLIDNISDALFSQVLYYATTMRLTALTYYSYNISPDTVRKL